LRTIQYKVKWTVGQRKGADSSFAEKEEDEMGTILCLDNALHPHPHPHSQLRNQGERQTDCAGI
jgi:hypothetical protein